MSRDSNYDHQISIFSPQGRLYQMEYALKAANHNSSGLTSVAVRGVDTVCILTQRKVPDRLIDPSSVRRLFAITDKMGVVATGLLPDCRAQVQRLRYEAAKFQFDNGYAPTPAILSKRMADISQVHSQSASLRPLASTLLLVGMDDERNQIPQIFRLDCAGHYLPFFACAAGSKEQEAMNFLEKKFEDIKSGDYNHTVRTAILCLGHVLGSDFKGSEIEVAVVSTKKADGTVGEAPSFRILSEDEVEGHLNAIADDADS